MTVIGTLPAFDKLTVARILTARLRATPTYQYLAKLGCNEIRKNLPRVTHVSAILLVADSEILMYMHIYRAPHGQGSTSTKYVIAV